MFSFQPICSLHRPVSMKTIYIAICDNRLFNAVAVKYNLIMNLHSMCKLCAKCTWSETLRVALHIDCSIFETF